MQMVRISGGFATFTRNVLKLTCEDIRVREWNAKADNYRQNARAV